MEQLPLSVGRMSSQKYSTQFFNPYLMSAGVVYYIRKIALYQKWRLCPSLGGMGRVAAQCLTLVIGYFINLYNSIAMSLLSFEAVTSCPFEYE